MLVPQIVIGERRHDEQPDATPDTRRFLTIRDSTDSSDLVARAVREAKALMVHDLAPAPESTRLRLERPAVQWRDEVVAIAIERITATDLEKVVLARQLVLEASNPFSIGRVIENLVARFPVAQVFAVDGFVGASPEQLVSRTERTVRANPLAGTARRSADVEVDAANIDALRGSVKDLREHRITIDWFLSELLPLCSYVDAEPEPSVLTLANVHHLGTLVEGLLSEPAPSALDLVRVVHPTPALGGAPQRLALDTITELEGFDRARYGGPTGWMDAQGNGEFAVAVRTAQIDGVSATVAAGVGVVAQSDPAAELEETQAKFQAMLGALLRAAD